MLEIVNEIKYLGIVIDKNLTFTTHISYVGKKIGFKLGVLKRVGIDLTPYEICSVQNYCCPIVRLLRIGYDRCSETNLQYLQKLQNKRMTVILHCKKKTRIKDMLEALRFMSIRERIRYNVCILVYKMLNKQCPSYLINRLEIAQDKRKEGVQTRQENKIYIEKCQTTVEQKTLFHDGFKVYNELPIEIKNEQTLSNFKRALVPYIKGHENN